MFETKSLQERQVDLTSWDENSTISCYLKFFCCIVC